MIAKAKEMVDVAMKNQNGAVISNSKKLKRKAEDEEKERRFRRKCPRKEAKG